MTRDTNVLKSARAERVRAKIRRNRWRSKRLRLSVFRSNSYIYGQIINDLEGKTLVFANEREIKAEGNKTQKAFLVGQILAEKAVSQKISEVVFDKGPYKFHGRIKAFADGVRKGGVKF